MFDSKWKDCLQRVEHWTNIFQAMKIDLRDLTKAQSDYRTMYMSHEAYIKQMHEKLTIVEADLSFLREKCQFLEVKTATQQRTVIHRYETPKPKGKK